MECVDADLRWPIRDGLLRAACAAFSFILLAETCGWAQEAAHSFPELQPRVHLDDRVEVTNKSGSTFKGKLVRVSPTSLRLEDGGHLQDFREADVQTIRRVKGPSLKKGAVLGGLIGGVGLPLIVCSGGETCSGEPAAVVGLFVGAGVASGMATAALLRRTTTIFEADKITLRVVPALTSQRSGVRLSISFR